MIRFVVGLFVALFPVAFVAADLPPALLPGMDRPVIARPVSKETGWIDVDWGRGGIGRAVDRAQQWPGLWVWSRAHRDGSTATVVLMRSEGETNGTGWVVIGQVIDADGNEWRTAANGWKPGNGKYPGWHAESGIGVDIWIDVGGAPPE